MSLNNLQFSLSVFSNSQHISVWIPWSSLFLNILFFMWFIYFFFTFPFWFIVSIKKCSWFLHVNFVSTTWLGRVLGFFFVFPFWTFNITWYSLLACKFSAEKSANILIWGSLVYLSLFFSWYLYKYFFAFLNFAILIMSWCRSFEFILFWTFCAFCTWICASLFRFSKFSLKISWFIFFMSYSLFYPSRTPIMWMLVQLLIHKSLNLSQFLKFVFFLPLWLCGFCCFTSLMHSSVSPNLLLIIPSMFFISIIVLFNFDF